MIKLFNENQILNQIKINRSQLEGIFCNRGFKTNSVKFNMMHNFYDISATITLDPSFLKLSRNNISSKKSKVKGDRECINSRIDSLVKDRNFQKYRKECHRGHLIARQLMPYTEYSDFNMSKNNPQNIYPQWVNANLNRAYNSEIWGQAHFEEDVISWLKKGKDIMYKVEPIFTCNNTDYPIGNIILAIPCNKIGTGCRMKVEENNEDTICVFIPNYLDTNIPII